VSGAYRASNMLPARRVRGIYRVEHAPCTTCTWHVRRAMRLLRAVVLRGCEAEVGGGLGTTSPRGPYWVRRGLLARGTSASHNASWSFARPPLYAPRTLHRSAQLGGVGAKGARSVLLCSVSPSARRVTTTPGAAPSLLGASSHHDAWRCPAPPRRVESPRRQEKRSWPPFAPMERRDKKPVVLRGARGGAAQEPGARWNIDVPRASQPRRTAGGPRGGVVPKPPPTSASHPRSTTARRTKQERAPAGSPGALSS
jgi:hypothetical protein